MIILIKKMYASIAPGLFIVGYVVGTGSVTSMVVAGARYGMSLTWALLLSCFFTYIMLIAIGRLTLVTGNTIVYNIKQSFGNITAKVIITGLMVTVISSISGVMGIMVEVTNEGINWAIGKNINTILLASFYMAFLLSIFWTGKHKVILQFMTLLVGLMALNFIISNFLIVQEPKAILMGLIPSIPKLGEPHLIIAGMVGTTMSSVVLISRSSLIAESNWTIKELKKEKKDALVAVCVTFLVSAAIMASAAGTLNVQKIEVENVIEMVHALKPLVGNLAILVLLIGITAAGLSSIFPNIVLLPWLVSDYNNNNRNLKSKRSRILAFVIGLSGLIIPVFGGKPIAIMIASQAFSPILMPMLIVFLLIMLNSKKIMGEYIISKWLNLALVCTLSFSIYMLAIAVEGYLKYFS